MLTNLWETSAKLIMETSFFHVPLSPNPLKSYSVFFVVVVVGNVMSLLYIFHLFLLVGG